MFGRNIQVNYYSKALVSSLLNLENIYQITKYNCVEIIFTCVKSGLFVSVINICFRFNFCLVIRYVQDILNVVNIQILSFHEIFMRYMFYFKLLTVTIYIHGFLFNKIKYPLKHSVWKNKNSYDYDYNCKSYWVLFCLYNFSPTKSKLF